jgi:hypothetical protein
MRDTLTVPSPATQQPRQWGTKPATGHTIIFPWCGMWILFDSWDTVTGIVGDDFEFEDAHGLPISDERAESLVADLPRDLVKAIEDEIAQYACDDPEVV